LVVIPTYFVWISVVFCICLIWYRRRLLTLHLDQRLGLDLALVLLLAGFIGARVFHAVWEIPRIYIENPYRIFEVWNGGFVWYGGALAAAAAGFGFLRWNRQPVGNWLDLIAPVAALGYGLGRMACVWAGCCHGRVCELPSGFSFYYPTQIFSVIWELSVFVILLWSERHPSSFLPKRRFSGQIFVWWLGLHALGRLIMESFRADPRGDEIWSLSISSWISLILLGLSLFFLIRHHFKQNLSHAKS